MARKATNLKKQTFRITEPDAQSVLLVGDFTDWQQRAIKMEKGSGGVWTTMVKLSPGDAAAAAASEALKVLAA